jgi:hypothetical protein
MKYRRRRSSGETHPTLYARGLRLKHIHPGGVACFLLFEGFVALAVLMALAEFVNWWAVVLLPLTVAVLVKVNDIVAGVFSRTGVYRRSRTAVLKPVIWARGVATVPAAVVPMAGQPVERMAVPVRTPSATYGVSHARRYDDAAVGVPVATKQISRRRAPNQRRFVTSTVLHQPGGVTR